MSDRFPRALVLGITALLPLLSGCGGTDENAKQGPTGPVEELYNNGVDALSARRYSSAADQFNAVEQNYPYSTWAVNAQLMSGYSLYLQKQIYRRHRHARSLYPIASRPPRYRLRLLPARPVLL